MMEAWFRESEMMDLHDEGACYVKYEKMQTCFHITVRK